MMKSKRKINNDGEGKKWKFDFQQNFRVRWKVELKSRIEIEVIKMKN